MAAVEVKDNTEQGQFEISVDGVLAGFAKYRLEPGRVIFFHTEIDPAFEGHGLGGKLAKAALSQVRESGSRVIATCPFIAGYIGKHPEFADLVVDGG